MGFLQHRRSRDQAWKKNGWLGASGDGSSPHWRGVGEPSKIWGSQPPPGPLCQASRHGAGMVQ